MQVLADLVQALYPDLLRQPSTSAQLGTQVQLSWPYFLRNVIGGRAPIMLSAQMCPLTGCSVPAVAICPYVFRACDGTVVNASAAQRCAPACPVGAPGQAPNGAPGQAPNGAPGQAPNGAAVARPALLASLVAAVIMAVLMVLA